MKIQVAPMDWRERAKKPRVYFSHVDESILENFENRRSRPIEAYRKLMVDVIPMLAPFGVPADVKYRWSQKAGCPCGCSPGFILQTHNPINIWVDFES